MQTPTASPGKPKKTERRSNDPSGVISTTSKPMKKSKKKSKKSKGESYTGYIYKMLKSVHPQMGMANKAMMIMNSFMTDAFERIAMESGKLCTYNKRETMTDREIRTAVRLTLPGELAVHAIEDGMRGVAKFLKNSKENQMGA